MEATPFIDGRCFFPVEKPFTRGKSCGFPSHPSALRAREGVAKLEASASSALRRQPNSVARYQNLGPETVFVLLAQKPTARNGPRAFHNKALRSEPTAAFPTHSPTRFVQAFEVDQTSWLRKRQLQTVPLFLILRWDSSPLLGSEYRRFPSRHLPHDTRALLATCLPQASAQRFRSLENTGLGGEDRSQATAAMSSRERRTLHWPWRFPN
jgi:hypothetical protein